MNPEIPQTPQEALEAKLTALLLGELPPDEAFALGRAIEQNPELAKLYTHLKQTIDLVRVTNTSPTEQSSPSPVLKLSESRRERLLAHFKTVRPRAFTNPQKHERSWVVPVGLAAAFTALLGGLLLPTLSKSKTKSMASRQSYLSMAGESLSQQHRKRTNLPSVPPNDLMQISGRVSQQNLAKSEELLRAAGQKDQSVATVAEREGARIRIALPSAPRGESNVLMGKPQWNGVLEPPALALNTTPAVQDVMTWSGSTGPSHFFTGVELRDAVTALPPVTNAVSPSLAWADNIHSKQGNVGLADGTTEAFRSRLQEALKNSGDGLSPSRQAAQVPAVQPPTSSPVTETIVLPSLASSETRNNLAADNDTLRRRYDSEGGTGGGGGGAGPLTPTLSYDKSSASRLLVPLEEPSSVEQAFRKRYGFDRGTGAGQTQQTGSAGKPNDPSTGLPGAPSTIPSIDLTTGLPVGSIQEPRQAVNVYSLDTLGYTGVSNAPSVFGTEKPGRPAVMAPQRQSAEMVTRETTPQQTEVAKVETSRAYLDAKRKLEYLQREQQLLQMKQLSEKIDVTLPKTSMVEIVDQASPEPNQSSGVFEKIRRAVTGGVERIARIKVEPDQTDISGLSERSSASNYDPYFIQSEFEVIQSEAILGKVIKDLNLDEVWGKKQGKDKKLSEAETLGLLKRRLDLKPLRNTSLIEIRAKGENSDEAAKIANAVAKAYKDRRVEQRLAMSRGGVEALEERFKKQEKDIEVAQQKVHDLRRQLHISDPVVNADKPLLSSETLRKIENQQLEGKTELDKTLEHNVHKDVAATATPDEVIPAGVVNFAATDANEVVKIYSELVGRQILSSSNLPQAQIALRTQASLTKQQAIQTLDAALALNGISMIPVGDKFVKAVRSPQANQTGVATDNVLSWPTSSNITQIVQLQHVKPSELVAALSQVTSLTNSALSLDSSQMLVLTDSPENLRRTLALVSKIDTRMGTASSTLETEIRRALTDEADETTKTRPKAPAPEPQPEVQTSEQTFSTFSLNVSDVSFKLAAASLEKGQMPDANSIRSEEFINAFDYRDPEPAAGLPIAFAWERARYPFAHNRDLLRFSLKTAAAGREPGRPLNIVLLLDNSGSMERADRVQIIHEALRALAGQLQPQDKLSVVTFARTARLWVDGVSGDQAGKVAQEISGLTPQGGTNLEEAMNLAYQTASRHYIPTGINRVVLLTDGAANLGDVEPESLKQKVETQRKQGIALDCFGIGWEGFNDDLLEVLSRNGDGRYAFINSPEEAATEFAGKLAGALHVAASDVKVQVEFNPNRVTAYRQIGYAKHQLTKEQFRDNTVDAAEIGAAESGNALYVIETNPAGEGPLAVVRVRYKIPGTTDYREHEWAVPYTGNAISLEQASSAMRLATTASAFSEWLAASSYAGEVTLDRLIGCLNGVPEVYGVDARPKKLESMLRQSKSIAGNNK